MEAANVQRSELAAEMPAEPISQVRIASRPARSRARSITVSRLGKRDLERLRELYPAEEHKDVPRPRTRAECAAIEGPCPWVGCRHHLYLDVLPSGNIKLNFPDLEPDELEVSCALDVADVGGVSLEQAGAYMNLTRERARQVQESGLGKLARREELREEHGGRRTVVRLRVLERGAELVQRAAARREFDPEGFASAELDDE